MLSSVTGVVVNPGFSPCIVRTRGWEVGDPAHTYFALNNATINTNYRMKQVEQILAREE